MPACRRPSHPTTGAPHGQVSNLSRRHPHRVVPGRCTRHRGEFRDVCRKRLYDGTIFHRVIPGFVVQGGGMQPGMQQKSTREPITNEADNNLNNLAGTLSMARTNEPHSATSQFFINLKNNDFLDHRGKTPQGWGYAVFGKVVEGDVRGREDGRRQDHELPGPTATCRPRTSC
ncbi:MAG: peptidylprolyl isomerase [Gammaproteobacteria bacterium]|nr:peptidylprolyl isomerase [Gammaproteobacteria bacterium]